jgi:hypothetical protein
MNANDDISSTDGAPTAEGADPTGSIGAPAASFPISPPPPPGADPSTVPAYGGVGTPPYGYGVAGPSWYGGAGTPWYGGAPAGRPWRVPAGSRGRRRRSTGPPDVTGPAPRWRPVPPRPSSGRPQRGC